MIQLDELNKRFETVLEGNCNICLEKLKNPVLESHCQNVFCGECLLTWLRRKSNCPLCRANIHNSDLIYIETETEIKQIEDDTPRQMTKLEKIADIIEKNPSGKYLIFSLYDSTFIPICQVLEENQISFSILKGHIKTRENIIQNFKQGDLQVIFLNSDFNGAGLNLQETTDIILYHEMSTESLNQIIGRANRIGRTQPLNVHHLQVSS